MRNFQKVWLKRLILVKFTSPVRSQRNIKFISVKRIIITSARTSAHLKWQKWVVHQREMKRELLQWASVMWVWEMLEFTGVEQKPETHIWLSSPWTLKFSSTSSVSPFRWFHCSKHIIFTIICVKCLCLIVFSASSSETWRRICWDHLPLWFNL